MNLWYYILMSVCFLPVVCLSAEELSVKATANRSQIYIGESFILEVTVSGSSGTAEFDFTGIKNANIRHLGARNISNYTITIINGKMTREGFSGFISSYEITPLASGKFQAGPISVKIDGKLLTDKGPVVSVTDIEKQDRVIISVAANRETTLIDEPFTVTLSLKIKCMPGEASGFEPLFPDNPPTLIIPWLDEELKGLAGPDIRQLLTGYLAPHWNQPGITINKFILASDPFDISSMFSHEQRKAKFALPGNKIQFNGQQYYEYNLQFDYIPKDEGIYVFGPVIFKGGVPERLDEHGRAVGVNIFAVGPAGTVRVIPPPDEGRPESYSGAIGSNLTVKAALDTASCNLGDPLTLTLTVAGQVKFDKILPPKLSLQTNLLQHFTIYDNTVQSVKKDSYNQYLYVIRPTQAGKCEIPPIEIAYYDVASRSYKKLFTSPLPLTVRRGAEVTEAQVIGSTNQLTEKKEGKDIRKIAAAPIRLDNNGALPASLLGDSRILLAAGAGPALYFIIVLSAFIGRSGRKIMHARHIHSAKDRAARRLKNAEKIGRKDLRSAAALICEAARKYLGERLNRDTSSATPAEAVSFLTENGVSKEPAEKFGAIYEKYFNAGFAHAHLHGSLPDDCRALKELIGRIDKELGRKSRPKESHKLRCLPVIIFIFCALTGGNALSLDNSECVFVWNEANAQMQNARTPTEYLRAALIYQRLIDDDVRNGPLFYNIGTALLLAERYELASDAFERAERYLGRQADNDQNLKIAFAKKTKSRTVFLPWYRLAALWHFYLSCPQRTYIASGAFLVFWLALSLRRLGVKRMTNTVAMFSLVVFVVFASSVAASWQMENSAKRFNLNAQPVVAPTNSSLNADVHS
ncbi:MAG: BatD family protein [Kiritimatiellia bacterium]|nr:BatD family protein [Kiritimatiellia bacterium]